MEVRFRKLCEKAIIPVLGTANSAGYDLFACINNDIYLHSNDTILVPTGIAIEIPSGYCGMICSRSGLALKYGIHVLNSPGIIDSDYRGELKCILHNCSNTSFTINNSTKIAQLLIIKYETIIWQESSTLSETGRGINGFGSTGI